MNGIEKKLSILLFKNAIKLSLSKITFFSNKEQNRTEQNKMPTMIAVNIDKYFKLNCLSLRLFCLDCLHSFQTRTQNKRQFCLQGCQKL